MAQLGNRLLRYEIVGEEQSEEELLEFLETYKAATVEDDCKGLVNEFAYSHFSSFPISTVSQESIEFPRELLLDLLRCSKLVAQGRVEVSKTRVESPDGHFVTEYSAGEPEGPHRVGLLLRTFALGYALMSGDKHVKPSVLESVCHLAFSSIPSSRRKTLRRLLTNGGQLDAATLMASLKVSQPTATDMMKELAATRLANFNEGKGSRGANLTLNKDWGWLLPKRSFAQSQAPLCAAATSPKPNE